MKNINHYTTATITEGKHKGKTMSLGVRIPLSNGVVICNGKTEDGYPIGITSEQLTNFQI